MRYNKLQKNTRFVDTYGRLAIKIQKSECYLLNEYAEPQQVAPEFFAGQDLAIVPDFDSGRLAQVQAIARYVHAERGQCVDMTQFHADVCDRLRDACRAIARETGTAAPVKFRCVDRLVNAYFGDVCFN